MSMKFFAEAWGRAALAVRTVVIGTKSLESVPVHSNSDSSQQTFLRLHETEAGAQTYQAFWVSYKLADGVIDEVAYSDPLLVEPVSEPAAKHLIGDGLKDFIKARGVQICGSAAQAVHAYPR